MENLTQTYGVVKPNVHPAALEGYKVVVFEETRGGTKLIAILKPGDSPLKKKFHLFSTSPCYSCYAVTSDCKLNFDFSADMTLASQYQDFTLNCSVYYHVSDPGAMAIAFNTDPILRIREEIRSRLQLNILQNEVLIKDIKHDFFALKDKILSDTTLSQLRDFAKGFGVIIDEIEMTYRIPEKYLRPNLKKEDYYLEKETAFIEEEEKRKKVEEEKEKLRHQHVLLNIALEHDFDKEMFEGLRAAIDKAIDSIDDPGSFKKDVDTSLGVINRVINELQDIKLYRHTKIDFPKKCYLEQEIELLVQLTIENPLETVVAQLVPIPMLDSTELIKLTLQVTASGFHVDNTRKTMNVPANDDSEKVIFKMKPLSAGNQLVEVEIYFNALRIGYFGLEIQVEEASNGQS